MKRERSAHDPYKAGIGWWLSFRIAALAVYLLARLTQRTTRRQIIDHRGESTASNAIYCTWHADVMVYFMLFSGVHRPAFMIGDSWKLTPLRICGRWLGVSEYIFGQAGRGGSEAAEAVIDRLERGYSTIVTPDGPHGPARELKPGVLHIARRSGVPIVVMSIEPSKRWVIERSWDRKWLLPPFSRAKITFHPPIVVGPDNFQEAKARLYAYLDA